MRKRRLSGWLILVCLLAACGESTPTPTRDRLLLMSDHDGWPDLYSLDAATSALTRLTESAEAEWGATWRADGRRIAFTALHGDLAAGDKERTADVLTMGDPAAGQRLVAANAFAPQWDGDQVYYLATDPAAPTNTERLPSLFRATDDGKPVPTKLLDGVRAYAPILGGGIVAVTGTQQARDLVTLDAAGKPQSLIARNRIVGLEPLTLSVAPDGSQLAVVGLDNDRLSLWLMNSDGTAARRAADYPASGTKTRQFLDSYAAPINPAPRIALAPIWRGDGKAITFSDGTPQIGIYDLAAAHTRYVSVGSNDGDAVLSVAWGANGTIIYNRATVSRTTLIENANAYVMDAIPARLEMIEPAVAKPVSRVLFAPDPPGSLAFSGCCGFSITPIAAKQMAAQTGTLWVAGGYGQRRLTAITLATHSRRVLVNLPARAFDFSPAPTGNNAIYMLAAPNFAATTLSLVSSDGATRRVLSKGTSYPTNIGDISAWTADGKTLLYQTLGGDPQPPGIYRLDLATPDSAPRLVVAGNSAALALAPNGQMVAYKRDDGGLYISRLEAGAQEQYVAQGGRAGMLFSPDSRLLVYANGDQPGYARVYLLDLSSTQDARLPVNPDQNARALSGEVIAAFAGWSSDSTRLYYSCASYRQLPGTAMISVRSGRTDRRTYGPGINPRVSPDGRALAVWSSGAGNTYGQSCSGNASAAQAATLQRLRFIPTDAGVAQEVTLTYPPYYNIEGRFYSWSPDSARLVYYSDNSLMAVDATGANPQVIGRAAAVEKVVWTK